MERIKVASCTIFVLLTLFFSNNLSTESKKTMRKDVMLRKIKGTVRTIKSEDGDIIDCVDIYKQPAFDHPLLKDHKIQDVKLKPKLGSKTNIAKSNHLNISQTWQRNGNCPRGTIPIRRTRNLLDFKKSPPRPKNISTPDPDEDCLHEYASVTSNNDVYIGAHGQLNVWNPQPEPLEFSLSQIWVTYDVQNAPIETMEVGWHVFPSMYGDYYTRLFTYWTADGYVSTGCYNICPGFVQTSRSWVFGGSVTSSTFNGPQVALTIDIYKDNSNWILGLNGGEDIVGYWPGNIFNNLAMSSNRVEWGGEIINCIPDEHHTATPMGSGAFPSAGPGIASFIREIEIQDQNENWDEPAAVELRVTNAGCYDLSIIDNGDIYFGGPGFSQQTCP